MNLSVALGLVIIAALAALCYAAFSFFKVKKLEEGTDRMQEIAAAILMLLERVKIVTEGAGAASVAAALYKKVPTEGKKVACVVSGGNVDVNFVAQIIQRGMLKNGRYREVTAAIGDKPGMLRRYLDIIANEKGNVISVVHDRNRADLPISMVSVSVLIETQGFEHGERILQALRQAGITLLKW